MIKSYGFFDLCISEICFSNENLEHTIKILYDYGYRTIAVNQLIEDGNIEPKKKKKKGEPRDSSEIVPIPFNKCKINNVISNLGLQNFKVLNRLTISFSNQEILHKITKSPNYKSYDIIAALPTTMQAFMFCCSTLEADILTFDPENKFSIKLNRKLYNQLIDRGYHFELFYSPAIENSTKRKNLIHASHLYHSCGKSTNVIFSSGAQNLLYIRSPYDIINLGFIFGLSEQKCKSAVTTCPHKVVVNAVGRRHGKAVMFVENVLKENENDIKMLEDSEGEDTSSDQPAKKKSKI